MFDQITYLHTASTEMSEHITNEQYVHSVRERVVEIARAMLDGQLSFLSGSRTLSALRHDAGVRDDDADFMAFVVIESETDELPIGQVREYWDKAALERLEPEIQAAEAWAKEQGKNACVTLIARYGEQ
jgi:hypothetical protein